MRYDSYQNFFVAIKDTDHALHETLGTFCQLVNVINIGCGCRRGAREEAAINKYKNLPNELPDHERAYLKETFGSEIEFYQHDQFCGKI